MTTMQKTSRKGEFTGWHMLAVMVCFFGVIIGVNVFMAVSASRTWTGLVVENSYVASQEFNTKLGVANARTEAGWQGGLDYVDNALVFSLMDKDGNPIDLGTITIEVSRPIGVEGDDIVVLQKQDDGTHKAPIMLEPGVWNAAITAEVPGEADYEHRARIIVD